MPEKIPDQLEAVRRQRLERLLEVLSGKGVTQSAVAKRVGMPAPYLTDMKKGHRPLTELSARRLAAHFGLDHRWLLGETGSMDSLHLGSEVTVDESTSIWLPVFGHPVEGPPRSLPKWDGSCAEVVGAAAARVRLATDPYILRFGRDDHAGRLRRGDLLLISQSTGDSAEIHVVRIGRGLYLARPTGAGVWQRLAEGTIVRSDLKLAGHAMGIVWAALKGR